MARTTLTALPLAAVANSREASRITGATSPDTEALRKQALFAGAVDPVSIRFRIVEYDKSTGKLLSIPCAEIGFRAAIETTARLIESRRESHFCLEPVGFVQ
jgi:hypothetical protein